MIKAAVIGGTNCLCDGLFLAPLWGEYDVLIISYMPPKLLADTALGYETEITKALIIGKKVYMLKSAIPHIKNLPEALIQLHNSYKNAILKLGVKVINYTDVVFKSQITKKTLTAAFFSTLSDTEIRVDRKTIITPLALDVAKQKNIKIIKDDTL